MQCHYHSLPIDGDTESLKKSFNILALLAPPQTNASKYNSFMNASKNTDVEKMLDQPSEKRSSVKKDVFIKGKQEDIRDVITFISNIVAFSRFWIKMSSDDPNDSPFVIQLIVEIADFVSSSEFLIFYEKYKNAAPFIPHTIRF